MTGVSWSMSWPGPQSARRDRIGRPVGFQHVGTLGQVPLVAESATCDNIRAGEGPG
jgi:hypothetical protein